MSKSTLFYGGIVLAIVFFALGVYYILPGVYHVLTTGAHPPMDPQPGHYLLFFGIAVLCVIAALVTRPQSKAQQSSIAQRKIGFPPEADFSLRNYCTAKVSPT